MKKYLFYTLIGFVLVVFSSCAMLIKGAKAELTDSEPYLRNISINSEPLGAKVFINGQVVGFTPLKYKLDPHYEYNIEFSKDGFKKTTFVLKNRVGIGWVLLDATFCFAPMLFDAETGDWKEFKQRKILVTLEK
jgi:hypothetical protein